MQGMKINAGKTQSMALSKTASQPLYSKDDTVLQLALPLYQTIINKYMIKTIKHQLIPSKFQSILSSATNFEGI